MTIIHYLVGGVNHPETYEFVNGNDDIPYMMENKKKNVRNHQPVVMLVTVNWMIYR